MVRVLENFSVQCMAFKTRYLGKMITSVSLRASEREGAVTRVEHVLLLLHMTLG